MKKTIILTICVMVSSASLQAQNVVLSAKALLSGCTDTTTMLMYDSLRVKGLIPLHTPYTTPGNPYNFNPGGSIGDEIISPTVLNTSNHNAISDWVFIQLRRDTAIGTVVSTRSILIQRDGDIVDVDGISPVTFTNTPSGGYYVTLLHRNHLGVMTALPVFLSNTVTDTVDFTTDSLYMKNDVLYNGPARKIQNKQVLWLGNTNHDRNVKYNGGGFLPYPNENIRNNDKEFILMATGGAIFLPINASYRDEDVNMDGKILYNGTGNDRNAILSEINALSTSSNLTLWQHTPN